MIEATPTGDRLTRIRARRALIDETLWQWNNPDQREVQPGFWLAYSCGPAHPAYDHAAAEEAWAKALREQAIINSLPGDLDYLLDQIDEMIRVFRYIHEHPDTNLVSKLQAEYILEKFDKSGQG